MLHGAKSKSTKNNNTTTGKENVEANGFRIFQQLRGLDAKKVNMAIVEITKGSQEDEMAAVDMQPFVQEISRAEPSPTVSSPSTAPLPSFDSPTIIFQLWLGVQLSRPRPGNQCGRPENFDQPKGAQRMSSNHGTQ